MASGIGRIVSPTLRRPSNGTSTLWRYHRLQTRRHRCAVPGPVRCSAARAASAVSTSIVSLATQALRILGGRKQVVRRCDDTEPITSVSGIEELIEILQRDYSEAYFVTGQLTANIYSGDCFFGDPTISFSGLARYKQNLELITPFLLEPNIELYSIEQLQKAEEGAAAVKARWRLTTGVKLPWRPQIDVPGATTYLLNDDGTQIISHVEEWGVTTFAALGQLLRPG